MISGFRALVLVGFVALGLLACGDSEKSKQDQGTWSVETDQSTIEASPEGLSSTWTDAEGKTTLATGNRAKLPDTWPAGVVPTGTSVTLNSVWIREGASMQAAWNLPGDQLAEVVAQLTEELKKQKFEELQRLDVGQDLMVLFGHARWSLTLTASQQGDDHATLILTVEVLELEKNSVTEKATEPESEGNP